MFCLSTVVSVTVSLIFFLSFVGPTRVGIFWLGDFVSPILERGLLITCDYCDFLIVWHFLFLGVGPTLARGLLEMHVLWLSPGRSRIHSFHQSQPHSLQKRLPKVNHHYKEAVYWCIFLNLYFLYNVTVYSGIKSIYDVLFILIYSISRCDCAYLFIARRSVSPSVTNAQFVCFFPALRRQRSPVITSGT